jgi:hypothetical protein
MRTADVPPAAVKRPAGETVSESRWPPGNRQRDVLIARLHGCTAKGGKAKARRT